MEQLEHKIQTRAASETLNVSVKDMKILIIKTELWQPAVILSSSGIDVLSQPLASHPDGAPFSIGQWCTRV